jgi:hypothetical protein
MQWDETKSRERGECARVTYSGQLEKTGTGAPRGTGTTPECARAQTEHARSEALELSGCEWTAATKPMNRTSPTQAKELA